MMKNILRATLIVTVLLGGILTLQSATTPIASAAKAKNCNAQFLTFPTWYRGLTNPDCSIKSPTAAGGISAFIWAIALNIIEMATQAAVYLAVFYVIYGGFQYLTSSGSPDKAVKARTTIRNALIGVVIATSATAIINTLSAVTTANSSVQMVVASVLNMVYFAAFALALVMIIISGYKFVVGGSSPETIKTAKNTILYSIIGLVIVILAFAITGFVLDQL